MNESDPNKNPFGEQDTQDQPVNNYDPYNQPAGDPYSQQGQNPYSQNPYSQPQQGQYMQNAGASYDQSGNTYRRPDTPQSGYSGPQYGNPYPYYQQYPAQTMPGQSTGMAVASMVLGICSIVFSLFMFAMPPLFLLPIIGLILGIVFKCKHLPVGKGMSTAGIITSIIGLLIPLLLLILVVALLLNNGAELMEFLRVNSPEEYQELYELYGEQFPEWFGGAMKFFGLM